MNYLIDLHIHTSCNPHAYSTVEENIERAIKKGLKVIALTNHGPAAQDSPHWWSLANMRVIPKFVDGLRVLKGVEANILDENGNFDLNQQIYDVMDIILCGLHKVESYPDGSDIVKNTKAVVNIIKSQKIDILVHPGNPQFPLDYETVVKEALLADVAIEINNSSLRESRKGSAPNCLEILKLCKKYNCRISLGSDAHISYSIGEFNEAEELIKQVEFPKDKIINSSVENLDEFLRIRAEKRVKKL